MSVARLWSGVVEGHLGDGDGDGDGDGGGRRWRRR